MTNALWRAGKPAFALLLIAGLFLAGRLLAESAFDLDAYGMSICDDYGNCVPNDLGNTTLIASTFSDGSYSRFFTYRGYVHNGSASDVTERFTNSFWGAPAGASFFPFLDVSASGLSRGQAMLVRKQNPAGTGSYSFKLCADKSTDTDQTGNMPRSNRIPETDESNNCSPSVSVKIISKPNISASIVGPSTLVAGGSGQFSLSASSDQNGDFSYSGQTCGGGALVSVSGNSFTCRFPTSGVYTVGAAVSQWSVPAAFSKTVSVSAPAVPNLSATLDKICDSYGQCSGALYAGALLFTATVNNSGSGPAGASTAGFFRADRRGSFASSNAPPLAAGGSASVAAAADFPAGSYQFFACADSGGAVNESNENDNCSIPPRSVTVVDKPTLTASLSSSPSGAVTAPASVTWSVNFGGTAVGDPTYSNPNCGDSQSPVAQTDGSFSCYYANAGGYSSSLTASRAGITALASGGITLSPPNFTLSVTKTGSGSGTVTGTGGISCGTSCSASFSSGTSVTLSASPASGSDISGWQGCDSISADNLTCTVAITGEKTVAAIFAPVSLGGVSLSPDRFSPLTNEAVTFNLTGANLYRPSPSCGEGNAPHPYFIWKAPGTSLQFSCTYGSAGSYTASVSGIDKRNKVRQDFSAAITVLSPSAGSPSPIPDNAIKFNESTTWPAPDGVHKVHVWAWGGGGAGLSPGMGGGGGGFAEGDVDVTPKVTYQVQVGEGGASGTSVIIDSRESNVYDDRTSFFFAAPSGGASSFGNVVARGGEGGGLTSRTLDASSSFNGGHGGGGMGSLVLQGGNAPIRPLEIHQELYQSSDGGDGAGGGGKGGHGTDSSRQGSEYGVPPGGGGGGGATLVPHGSARGAVGGAPGRVVIAPVSPMPLIHLTALPGDCGGKVALSWNSLTTVGEPTFDTPPPPKGGYVTDEYVPGITSNYVIDRWRQDPRQLPDTTQADQVIVVGADQTSFLDTDLRPGTTYWYKIRTFRRYEPHLPLPSSDVYGQGWGHFNAFGDDPGVTDFWDHASAAASPLCPTPPDLKAQIRDVTGNKPPYIPANPYVKDATHQDADGAYHFYTGSPVTVEGTISNQGKVDISASTPFSNKLYDSSVEMTPNSNPTPTGPISGLAGGSSTSYTAAVSLKQGTHILTLCANRPVSPDFTESDSSNASNCSSPVKIVMEPIRVPQVKLFIVPAELRDKCMTLKQTHATILKGSRAALCWETALEEF